MRALVLVALLAPFIGCTRAVMGHRYTGADVELHYQRRSDTETSVDLSRWNGRYSSERSVHSGGASVTLRFEYKPPTKRKAKALARSETTGI